VVVERWCFEHEGRARTESMKCSNGLAPEINRKRKARVIFLCSFLGGTVICIMEFENADSGTPLITKSANAEGTQPLPFRKAVFRANAPPKLFTHYMSLFIIAIFLASRFY
jgi:hypothetical protein